MTVVKPYSFSQFLAIIRHSYGYTQQVNMVKFLVNRTLKMAPWGAPLGILGLFFVYPCVSDATKWEFGLPYNKPKTNIKLNTVPTLKEVEVEFG